MSISIGKHGILKVSGTAKSCPWDSSDQGINCGEWCALFVYYNDFGKVCLHCAPNPLTYTIDEFEEDNGN